MYLGYKFRIVQILTIHPKVFKVNITNDSHIGRIELIPRIGIAHSESSLPFN